AGARLLDPAGDPARTEFRVVQRDCDPSGRRRCLLEVTPQSGRTNQIRLHLWSCDLPIIGDGVYLGGGQLGDVQTLPTAAAPLRLHAWVLAFQHPAGGESVEFRAPPPDWAAPLLAGPHPS